MDRSEPKERLTGTRLTPAFPVIIRSPYRPAKGTKRDRSVGAERAVMMTVREAWHVVTSLHSFSHFTRFLSHFVPASGSIVGRFSLLIHLQS